jgi:hypothetical protein
MYTLIHLYFDWCKRKGGGGGELNTKFGLIHMCEVPSPSKPNRKAIWIYFYIVYDRERIPNICALTL